MKAIRFRRIANPLLANGIIFLTACEQKRVSPAKDSADSKVLIEANEQTPPSETAKDSSDLKGQIQGFWVPNVDAWAEEWAKKKFKEEPEFTYEEHLKNCHGIMAGITINMGMRIDKDSIEKLNEESGAPNSRTFSYEHVGMDTTNNRVQLLITGPQKPGEMALSVEDDILTVFEEGFKKVYDRVDEAEFERRRIEPGL